MSETSEERIPAPKPKRTLSDAQLAALARGRARRAEKRSEVQSETERAPALDELPPESEEIENGQRLVRVPRQKRRNGTDAARPPPDPAPSTELDEYLQRRFAGRPPPEEEPIPEDNLPSIKEVAQRTEFYSAGSPIPPEETDPSKRDRPTIEVTDHVGTDFTPETLDDLMSFAPIGDGNYYITVDRKWPTAWGSLSVRGMQRPITEPMTAQEFQYTYGGGKYNLILYGPPSKNGMGVIDPVTKKVRPKRLSPAVTYTIPIDGSPPIVVSDESEEDDDDDPRSAMQPGFTRRPATPADAKMYEAQLGHEERQQDRQEQREKERSQKEDDLRREKERDSLSMVQLVSNMREQDILRIERERKEAVARAERDAAEKLRMVNEQRQDPVEMMRAVAELSKTMGGGNASASEAHLRQMTAEHQAHIERLTKAHQEDLEREMKRTAEAAARADRMIKDAEDRANQRVIDVERRCEDRMRELREASASRVTEVETNCRRQLEDADRRTKERMDDQTRQHERELRSFESTYTSRLETQKTTFELQMSAKDQELARMRGEVHEQKREILKSKDITGRINEIKLAAEELGMREGGGDEAEGEMNWQQVGIRLAARLPEMVESAGKTIAALRQQNGAPVQPHMMMPGAAPPRALPAPGPSRPALPSGQPYAFATEDGPEFAGPADIPYMPPTFPEGHGPSGPIARPQQAAPAAPPQQVAPQPQQAPPVVAVPPAPPPARPPPTPQADPAAPPAAVRITDEEILQFIKPYAESALDQGATPDEAANHFAHMLAERIGRDQAAAIAAALKAGQVISAISNSAEGASSALVRPAGQKWLRATLQKVQQIFGTG